MKQMLLLLSLVLIASYSIAQGLLGFKAGGSYVNIGKVNLPKGLDNDSDYMICYHAGITGAFPLHKKLSLRSELLYTLKGEKSDVFDVKIHYLNLPVIADFSVFPKLNLELGTEIGYKLAANQISKCAVCNFIIYDFKNWDIGMLGGFRYYITDRIQLGARYTHGILNIENLNFTDANGEPVKKSGLQNRALQLSLGYEFSLGKH